MDLMVLAHLKYNAIVAPMRTRKAMNSTTRNDIAHTVNSGDGILIYREKVWEEPYNVLYLVQESYQLF